jgi:VacB/RNase II family 3'-5' exoribonuclease
MHESIQSHRSILFRIARNAMIGKGLLPEFSKDALDELASIRGPAALVGENVRDQRDLLWVSIDNDDSLDLDQLTVSEVMPQDRIKVLVAIADVDSIVRKECAIDTHARYNTTSVYTAAAIFPMLPEKLSTDLTSLNYNEDRRAIVVEIIVEPDGSVRDSDIYFSCVRNRAKLAYNSVAAWLDGNGTEPVPVQVVAGLGDNLRLQDKAAQRLKNYRHANGALSLETIEGRPVFDGDEIHGLEAEETNRAKMIIEDFMIAANGVTARYLSSKGFPSLRRVVRAPKRWDRIVEIAGARGCKLPVAPDSKALEDFLTKQKNTDPLRFPDLSLSVIKLLGPGEYVAELPGSSPGHFGLAVKDYTHSTAPNRRYPDIITQRLLKAAISGAPAPYDKDGLDELGRHCTDGEDRAKKVERQVVKSAAAMLLESRIGEQFDSIVTGAGSKGTWVRVFNPPVEGRLSQGYEGADIGDRIVVQLIYTDVERGFIDFKRTDR